MTERARPVKTHAAPRQSVSWPSLAEHSLGSNASPVVRAGTSSGGQALDKKTQRDMSSRFGHDFSQVRIHTDARAGDSAEAMGANAYALGSDIVFGGGKYQPGSRETERLLAHELTHVAQQSQLGGGDWGRTSHKGDASEREADSLASHVMMGRSVQVQAAPGAAVARDAAQDLLPNASAVYGPPDDGYCSTNTPSAPTNQDPAKNGGIPNASYVYGPSDDGYSTADAKGSQQAQNSPAPQGPQGTQGTLTPPPTAQGGGHVEPAPSSEEEYDEFSTKKPEKTYMEKWAGPDSWVGNNQNDPALTKLGKGFLAAPISLGGLFAEEFTHFGTIGMMKDANERAEYGEQYESNKKSAQQIQDQEARRRQEETSPAPFVPRTEE